MLKRAKAQTKQMGGKKKVRFLRAKKNRGYCQFENESENEYAKKQTAKEIATKMTKRVKKTTWRILRHMYKGLVYSSYLYSSAGVGGLDPQYCASAFPNTYPYRNVYAHQTTY